MDALSTTFAALADPTRRAILAKLAEGPATVKELSTPFPISGPAITKHLKVLEHAGLIARGRTAQWRPCHLQAAPLKEVAEWAERYRQFWEASFDSLDDYLRELQRGPPGGRLGKGSRSKQRSRSAATPVKGTTTKTKKGRAK